MVRVKDKCPSCFQPIAPTDFLCPHCELILDATQATTRPVSEVSVVRRLLEIPQRGVPSERPDTKAARATAKRDGSEGPTRVLNLGPELAGVPVVVATLTRKAQQLTELEAWVVSIIDGLSDAAALAKKAGLKELELRVLLRTLCEKQIIDFADEPLSDEDLDMPILGTLEGAVTVEAPPPSSTASAAGFERRDGRFVAPPSSAVPAKELDLGLAVAAGETRPPLEQAAPSFPFPPAPPRESIPAPAPSFPFPPAPPRDVGARAPVAPAFPFPPAPARVVGTPAKGVAPAGEFPFPPAPAPAPARAAPKAAPGRAPPPPPPPSPPIVPGRAEPPMLSPSAAPAKPFTRRADAGVAPPYPNAKPSREAALSAPAPEPAPAERTDPRIAYQGNVNRKVLDALKKVKRADPVTAPVSGRASDEPSYADVLARDTLQVALRMEQGGRFEEAIRFLERSIAQSPDAPSLYNRLGIILMRERADYRRAEELIRKATELAPDNNVYATNLRQVISQQALKRR